VTLVLDAQVLVLDAPVGERVDEPFGLAPGNPGSFAPCTIGSETSIPVEEVEVSNRWVAARESTIGTSQPV